MNRKKYKKYIISSIMLSLLCINNVYADCTQEAKDEFKEIEDQYKITTKFNSKDKTYNMKIETGKPDKYNYIFTIQYSYQCEEISNTVTECTGLKPGTSFYARIIGKTSQCDTIVKEEVIELERYNEFYGDPLCEGIEEFVLCQETYNREINRETFEKRVNAYKENKKQKKEENVQTQNPLNETTTYIEENLVQIIIVIIFIILVITSVVVMINSSRKSRRLE